MLRHVFLELLRQGRIIAGIVAEGVTAGRMNAIPFVQVHSVPLDDDGVPIEHLAPEFLGISILVINSLLESICSSVEGLIASDGNLLGLAHGFGGRVGKFWLTSHINLLSKRHIAVLL